MADPYIIPRRLDDPELIGFWTIDEFCGMLIPFTLQAGDGQLDRQQASPGMGFLLDVQIPPAIARCTCASLPLMR